MALIQNQIHTVKDIYDLPEGQRAELIDGQIYSMAPPKRIHQRLIHQLDKRIGNYIDTRGRRLRSLSCPICSLSQR